MADGDSHPDEGDGEGSPPDSPAHLLTADLVVETSDTEERAELRFADDPDFGGEESSEKAGGGDRSSDGEQPKLEGEYVMRVDEEIGVQRRGGQTQTDSGDELDLLRSPQRSQALLILRGWNETGATDAVLSARRDASQAGSELDLRAAVAGAEAEGAPSSPLSEAPSPPPQRVREGLRLPPKGTPMDDQPEAGPSRSRSSSPEMNASRPGVLDSEGAIIPEMQMQQAGSSRTRSTSPAGANSRGTSPSGAPVLRTDGHAAPAAVPTASPFPMLPPSPPRRNLRTRKADQLNPYTYEQLRYQRELMRNDWEDAVVSQREWARQERRRLREEAERANAVEEELTETQSQWLVPDPQEDPEESERRNWARREKLARKEARRVEREKRRRNEMATMTEGTVNAGERAPSRAAERPLSNGDTSAFFDTFGGELSSSSDESQGAAPAKRGGDLVERAEVQQRRPQTYRRRKGKEREVLPPDSSVGGNDDGSQSSSPVLPARKHRRLVGRSGTSSSASESGDEGANALPPVPSRRAISVGSNSNSESSADELPRLRLDRSRSRTARTDAESQEGSDIDYERHFRQLKRMMPVAMARKYIQDLKNMRRGKAYHSDGHVSSTPDPSTSSEPDDLPDPPAASTPATSPLDPGPVLPGEARKRMGAHADGPLLLEGDPDSESSSEPSARMVSSASEEEDGDIRWWARPMSPYRRFKEADAVDRMLTRTGGGRSTSTKKARPKGPTSGNGTRARAVGARPAVASRPVSSRPALVSSRPPPLQDRSNNVRPSVNTAPAKRSKKRKRRPGTTSIRTSSTYGPAPLRANPPVVTPRKRPKLDLINDDALFDFEMGNEMPNDQESGGQDSQIRASREALPFQDRAQERTRSAIQSPAARLNSSPSMSQSPSGAQGHTLRRAVSPSWARPAAVPPQGRAPAHQPRITAALQQPRPSSSAPMPEHLQAQHIEAESWDDIQNLRLDFGIRPLLSGIAFDQKTYIGRGRLYELLSLARSHHEGEHQDRPIWSCQALGLELNPFLDVEEILAVLPSIFDAIFTAVQSARDNEGQGGDAPLNGGIEDLLRFLAHYVSSLPSCGKVHAVSRTRAAILSQLEHLYDRFRATPCTPEAQISRSDSLLLWLQWFKVEMCWRSRLAANSEMLIGADDLEGSSADDLEEAVRALMVSLLAHGLNRTMKSVKLACSEEGSAALRDSSAELWVCLIHLLSEATLSVDLGPQMSFWPVFDTAIHRWLASLPPRRPLLVSETMWYAVFSVCALSHFSAATGATASRPHLPGHWPIVVSALSVLRFRFNDKVERAMPGAAIAKRDGYVRAVLQRCCNLASLWHWRLENADGALARLFEIFNSHRLADLPSEKDHDFPPFLREYDERLLENSARCEENAFHVFARLLAWTGRDLRESARDPNDADRRVSRLFSRMSPVRVMNFTKANPPTSTERSMLFNHYTVVMLFLHLLPSAATQRLRQIRSFLPFREADPLSQVSCVRAMLYAAVIHRHHGLDIGAIMAWFAEMIGALMQTYEEHERAKLRAPPDGATRGAARYEALRGQRQTAHLLVATLRSIQHIIEHPSLQPDRPGEALVYPDTILLHPSWTRDILEAQVAIDPAIGHEALKCVQTFLLRRNAAMSAVQAAQAGRNAAAVATAAAAADRESQDSFSEFFDDGGLNFEDPALDDLLGEAPQPPQRGDISTKITELKSKDREFAEVVRSSISPAIYRLVSNIYHPDRVKEGRGVSLGVTDELLDETGGTNRHQLEALVKEAERRQYVEIVIDCWVGCAYVMVQNGMKDWNSYLTLGNESWKRIDDPIGKRDVGLRFMQNIAVLDPAAYTAHQAEFICIWFQTAIARCLSIQDVYTTNLLELDPQHALFRNVPVPRDEGTGKIKLKLSTFERARLEILAGAFTNMRTAFDDATNSAESYKCRSLIISCLSGLLSAMRHYVEDPAGAATISKWQTYLEFCAKVVEKLRQEVGPTILRGIASELASVQALLKRQTGLGG